MNPYEQLARQEKVKKLADVCSAYGIRVDQVAEYQRAQWVIVAEAAGVIVPSEKTIALVLADLKAREALAAEAQQVLTTRTVSA
jgi:hypothetical protein